MKKLIILAMVALASTAGAQAIVVQPQVPQYLPPSYDSQHGGTQYWHKQQVAPSAPEAPLPTPNTGGGVPVNHFLDSMTNLMPHGEAKSWEAAKARRSAVCESKGFNTPECKEADKAERGAFNTWWEAFKRAEDASAKEAQRRQKAFHDEFTRRYVK